MVRRCREFFLDYFRIRNKEFWVPEAIRLQGSCPLVLVCTNNPFFYVSVIQFQRSVNKIRFTL